MQHLALLSPTVKVSQLYLPGIRGAVAHCLKTMRIFYLTCTLPLNCKPVICIKVWARHSRPVVGLNICPALSIGPTRRLPTGAMSLAHDGLCIIHLWQSSYFWVCKLCFPFVAEVPFLVTCPSVALDGRILRHKIEKRIIVMLSCHTIHVDPPRKNGLKNRPSELRNEDHHHRLLRHLTTDSLFLLAFTMCVTCSPTVPNDPLDVTWSWSYSRKWRERPWII